MRSQGGYEDTEVTLSWDPKEASNSLPLSRNTALCYMSNIFQNYVLNLKKKKAEFCSYYCLI